MYRTGSLDLLRDLKEAPTGTEKRKQPLFHLLEALAPDQTAGHEDHLAREQGGEGLGIGYLHHERRDYSKMLVYSL